MSNLARNSIYNLGVPRVYNIFYLKTACIRYHTFLCGRIQVIFKFLSSHTTLLLVITHLHILYIQTI